MVRPETDAKSKNEGSFSKIIKLSEISKLKFLRINFC
jgi:hypothetical protein